ncbi:MAG: flavodoxin [Hydrogenophaga sp.]|uniref:flavodoxin n=1 Tax=Hydrogenophaga sp. TaxID=1904254 RepID=UPI002ABAD2A5|nr:flavodoxin [Hydrogenophaga sp.]MDZ4281312.1 flavodoxin [Hydrogenophaga sp.]
MNTPQSPSRRAVLSASVLLPVAASSLAASATPGGSGKTLVAYFSRTGNTRVMASQIQRARGADLFEIKPAAPYPEDYEQTVAQARRERDSGFEPALQAKVVNMADYATVFLGFPIWGETAPPVIRSFLSSHDLAGKTLIPFITHGGYGLGSSLAVLAAHAPRARLLDASLSMEADQERRTLTRVTEWLQRVPRTR